MLLLTSWADMTFSSKDVLYICWFVIQLAWVYFTIKSNKREIGELKERIVILEKKYDDFKADFGRLEVQLAKLRFEIVRDVISEVRKIFSNKK